MKTSNILMTFSGLLLALGLQSCSSQHSWYPFLYRPMLSQGNMINENTVSQLKIGMSRQEVIQLMGSPLVETPLSSNHWNYVYSLREKNKVIKQKRLILIFDKNYLMRIQK